MDPKDESNTSSVVPQAPSVGLSGPPKSVYMHRSITAYGTIAVAVSAMIGAIVLMAMGKISYDQYRSQLLLAVCILLPSPLQHIFGKSDGRKF